MADLTIVADRSIKGEVAAVDPQDGLHLFGGQVQFFADLGAGGFDSGAMDVLAVALGDLMQRPHLFEREAYRAPLLRQGMHDRLPNPPHGVGNKLDPPRRIEPFGRLDQTDVTLIDEVGERETAADILARDTN